jgi:hypothetical protein
MLRPENRGFVAKEIPQDSVGSLIEQAEGQPTREEDLEE